MKKWLRTGSKVIVCTVLLCVVCIAILYINNDIGVAQSGIERDIRLSQKIKDDWVVEGGVSDTMAAYISYPIDKSDHTVSVYVNRSGLSFGYFFRFGGDLGDIENNIVELTIDGYNEKAFISMNRQSVERLEIDDGNSVRVIEFGGEPFAIVLPTNAGSITFFDAEGNEIEWKKRSI